MTTMEFYTVYSKRSRHIDSC